MSTELQLRWEPPGPVAAAFMASTADFQILNGPVGSGKTTTAITKPVRLARHQRPSTTATEIGPGGKRMAVRKFKLCIVRETYRDLWRTTIPSWQSRYPVSLGGWSGSSGAPASHRILFAPGDGTLVDFIAEFVAIGDNTVEEVLRGYEPTAFYLNELDLLSREVAEYAITRTGRYPPEAEGGPTWHGILADCNAPVIDSWLYDEVFQLTPEELAAKGIALFRQPGGLSAGAENLHNLPGGRAYYERQVRLNPKHMTRRMVHNLPGFNRNGMPVYGDDYNDLVHVAPGDIEVLAHRPLIIGLDGGQTLNPAGAFTQRDTTGKWRVLDELVPPPGTGAKRFGQALAQRLRERFAAHSEIIAFADPTAFSGVDRAAGDRDWAQIVAAEAGIRIRPAPTNSPVARWEAVRRPLTAFNDGTPDFQLSPRCRVLRSGFNAGYRFRAIVGTNGRFSEEAEKTRESHPHDALQYALSGGGENVEIRRRAGAEAARSSRHMPPVPARNPYAA